MALPINATGSIATPNQITIWLENDTGYNNYMAKFHNDKYFLHFPSVDDPVAMGDLDEGFDYLLAKITGQPTTEKYGFAISKRVTGGIAGAAYLYADPPIQRDIATLEKNLITLAQQWAIDHGAVMNTPQYNVGTDKFLVLTITIKPVVS